MGRIEDLGKAMDRRRDTVEKTVAHFYERIEEAAQTAREQSQELIQAAEEAAIQARASRESHAQGKKEIFLRTATVMIEDLNAAAIDIDQVMENDIPDDVWKRYQKGDRSIFARRLLRQRDNFSNSDIEKLYENDSKFREQATRYMNQFESLLNQANECDPDNVLSTTFLTADVGKLYLMLARSLGRQQ
jgi:ABC-type Fe3+/spermidine/putrescine transport system ATPase subunit